MQRRIFHFISKFIIFGDFRILKKMKGFCDELYFASLMDKMRLDLSVMLIWGPMGVRLIVLKRY